MNVGILTFCRINYGAILQSLALQTIIKSLGHQVEIIDYESTIKGTAGKFAPNRYREAILLIFKLIHYGQFRIRKERITDFKTQYISFSREHFKSSLELENAVSKYDVFICGSDQVWRPSTNSDQNRTYFLGFVSQKDAIKISYAPSFGVSILPKSHKDEVRLWLNDISNLSVREQTGQAIIKEMTGRNAEIVLDPTLLLKKEHWQRYLTDSKIKITNPYILVYSTSQRGLIRELVKFLKKRLNLPVVVLSLTSLNLIPRADRVVYDAGISEFIQLFSNATCVCTNSFHGTAFSIIFKKPFWTVPHNLTNSRIADLLSRIGLSDRQIKNHETFPESPLEIDYRTPEKLLDHARQLSISFLKSALGLMPTDGIQSCEPFETSI